jgi:hypothetical protein
MYFHGRRKSLVAGDSVAATGAVFGAVETEPDVMRSCKNRNRKRDSSTFYKSQLATNESSAMVFPLALWHTAKQSALQKPEFLNIMPSSRRIIPQGALGLMFLYSS